MLGGGAFGGAVVLYDSIDSTNTRAVTAARGGCSDGSLFIAEHQRSGRGRRGRSWFSTAGKSLLFSIVVDPGGTGGGLTSLLAVSSARALGAYCGDVMIKWPNDLCIGGRKLAGILAEAMKDHAVIGMGLNVNQEQGDFPQSLGGGAVSLKMASGVELDRGKVLAAILGEFETSYGVWRREGLGRFVVDIGQRLMYMGEEVLLECGDERFTGTMLGITDEGFLRLAVGGVERVVASGDVTLRREGR
jgi:BirA family biotin operon repressor/biotin-[acetyl-CoA-carboxylase] ligase